MPKREDIRSAVQTALQTFASGKLADNTKGLLNALGYDSDKTYDLNPNTYEGFYQDFARKVSSFDPGQAKAEEWTSADIIFQVADEDLNQSQNSMFSARALQEQRFNSLVFMAVGLQGETYTRTDLAKITREVNKCLPMPVIILFRHGSTLTLAVIQRRQNLRAGDQDVLAKVTLVKDIDVAKPHTAHVRILAELSLDDLADRKKHRISNFETLFGVWQEVLDTTELNKRFYRELSNWYFWALQHARFPDLPGEGQDRQAVAMIRLITRLIFVWFLKEKNLVSDTLFDRDQLNTFLTPEHHLGSGDGYYRAILQNLFFATLNTEMNSSVPESRSFKVPSQKGQSYNREYMMHTLYRYQSYFKDPDAALRLFADIPFLNGGLFECLDRAASESPSGKEERIDGFSDSPRKQAQVPDKLFFGEENVDLNDVYGTKNKRLEHVRGILNIFNGYKFTVDENTPIEEEVALDPELLGKVFENLLASYNPETETTARKQTGSFYTPREIVNYMVDESLIAYFAGKLSQKGMAEEAAQEKLRPLFAYLDVPHTLTDDEVATLITAIDEVKILDPACGSGAFPMGVLLRLVEILGQLDPDNDRWQKQQLERVIAPVLKDKQQAEKISYDKARESAIAELDERLKEIKAAFAENDQNYARKLFLIENCIYGVDIQPIAVQIAKLRFFITLIVDQRVDNAKKNRGIIALPNLETKFVAANTLLSLDTQTGFVLPEVAEKEKELEQVRSEHFNARRYADKKALREWDKKLRGEIEVLLAGSGFGKEVAHQLASWNPYDQSSAADFFDARWMFDANEGFNVVIGNPPYGVRFSIEEKRYFSKTYKHQDYQLDSYLLFLEKSFDFLMSKGYLLYIIPNTWLTNLKLQKIRQFLVGKHTIKEIIHYEGQVFDAVVDNEVVFFQKGVAQQGSVTVQAIGTNGVLRNIVPQIKWKELNGEPINIFLTEKDTLVLEKIKRSSYFLDNICNVAAGMSPYEVGKGKPPQTRAMLQARVYDAKYKVDNTYAPLLRGRDIEKYLIKWDGTRWIKYGENLAAPRSLSNFDAPEKIVIRQTGDSLIAALDDAQFICMKNMHTINRKDERYQLPFILALLNSKLLNYYFQALNPEKGETLAEVKKEHVGKLPIRKASDEQQGLFSLLTKYISFLKSPQNNPLSENKLDTENFSQNSVISTYLERILDGMVYELYLPDELHAADRYIIKHVESENLPALEDITGGKLAALQAIFERL